MPSDDEPYHCEQCASKKEAGDASSTLVAQGGGGATGEDKGTMVTKVVVATSTVTTVVVPTLERYREFEAQDSRQHLLSLAALEAECKSPTVAFSLSWDVGDQPLMAYDEKIPLKVREEVLRGELQREESRCTHPLAHAHVPGGCLQRRSINVAPQCGGSTTWSCRASLLYAVYDGPRL
jgi:hypothetical protein